MRGNVGGVPPAPPPPRPHRAPRHAPLGHHSDLRRLRRAYRWQRRTATLTALDSDAARPEKSTDGRAVSCRLDSGP